MRISSKKGKGSGTDWSALEHRHGASKGLELIASSDRGAPASGSSSGLAFGGVRSPAVHWVESNEYGFRCRTPRVTLNL
jgi:hypothetical protein